jgi:hypothetical protein
LQDEHKEEEEARHQREKKAQEARRKKAEKLKVVEDEAIQRAAKKKQSKELQRAQAMTLPASAPGAASTHHMHIATWQWENMVHNWIDMSDEISLQLDWAEQSREGRLTIAAAITSDLVTEVAFHLNQRKMIVDQGGKTATYRVKRCRKKQLEFVQKHEEKDPDHDKWEIENDKARANKALESAATHRGSQDVTTGFSFHLGIAFKTQASLAVSPQLGLRKS